MNHDYDLVIIGNTPQGIYAALEAVNLKARVALVEQPSQELLDGSEMIFSRRFTHVAHLYQQWLQITPKSQKLDFPITGITDWASAVNRIISQQYSPASLSALGIDFIKGSGEFVRLPRQAFVVGQRKLRSPAYLLATGFVADIPEIKGLAEVGYLIPWDLWHKDQLSSLPEKLVIVGGNNSGITLAQGLKRAGKSVTLVVEENVLLPEEDEDIVNLLQAQLEAEGIKLLTDTNISQIRKIDQKKWLQFGSHAIECEEIIFAPKYADHIKGLNLEAVGVKIENKRIVINNKLQTNNPCIYACGSNLIAGGARQIYSFDLALYQAHIAVKNALFLPFFQADCIHLPSVVFTAPPLGRVGLTLEQAKAVYGNKVREVLELFKNIPQGQILGETTGMCKLVVRDNGEIVGGHIFGANAEELIALIALGIRAKIKVEKLAEYYALFPTLSAIINRCASEWQRQRIQENKLLQNLLEQWFIWRKK